MIAQTEFQKIRDELYYSENFSEIIKELEHRAENKNIDKKLNKYWEPHKIPYVDFLKGGPYAILSRSIASPNLEQQRFLRLAKRYHLKPVILEYNGKFVTKNIEKFSLCKLHFFTDNNNREYKMPEKINITNTNKYQGKKMNEIITLDNKSLAQFHHELFDNYCDSGSCDIYNFTDWFNETRILKNEYYFYFLLIFMKNAVLFDNYVLSDESENEFIESKILPSVEKIEKIFGFKPLVYPLVPFKNESSIKWLSYNNDIKTVVENKFK